ncbi:MAG: hypothetical protein M3O35_19720, partial [Acidobacteriota bacterium]|nr:hypothetical protein [Acidobacteriota bacterium]
KLLLPLALLPLAHAETPYFVTYSHHLEEPGSLEISYRSVIGSPPFASSLLELEYGLTGWWTTELYLSGATAFTGWRWEHRIRPLLREHWINPVLYVEFEDINGADKSLLAVVGHDGAADQAVPTSVARREGKRELETKLILSSYAKGWNVAENFIAEKNLTGGEWEFGYALAVSRALASKASPLPCSFCRENLRAGVEMYGGLGTRHDFGLRDTSHYVAPALAWRLPNGAMLGISPSFGLTGASHQFLLRFNLGIEIPQFARLFRK